MPAAGRNPDLFSVRDMKTATMEDAIRANGLGVSLECGNCKAAKAMDDLQRTHIGKLYEAASEADVYQQFLVDRIQSLHARVLEYRLSLFAMSLVAILALAQDAGWFK
jgi:hypothetical protein